MLITGGSSGLGRCLAGMYGMRGASVAVLDVVVPEEGLQGVRFYRCDVSQLEAVQRAKEKIEADVCIIPFHPPISPSQNQALR